MQSHHRCTCVCTFKQPLQDKNTYKKRRSLSHLSSWSAPHFDAHALILPSWSACWWLRTYPLPRWRFWIMLTCVRMLLGSRQEFPLLNILLLYAIIFSLSLTRTDPSLDFALFSVILSDPVWSVSSHLVVLSTAQEGVFGCSAALGLKVLMMAPLTGASPPLHASCCALMHEPLDGSEWNYNVWWRKSTWKGQGCI